MVSMEKVTAKAMKMFMKMDEEEVSPDEEENKEDTPEPQHIDKKQKKPADPVVHAIHLTVDDTVKITLAAVEYHIGTKDRWDYGYDAVKWAKEYAQKVVEKSKQLKYAYGESFNAEEIAKAFDEKTNS